MNSLLILLTAVHASLGSGASHGDDPAARLPLPEPVTDRDYHEDGAPAPALVELGRSLFFDKILSGNRNISCATCHHPSLGTSDGVALSLGEGADGLGTERRAGTTEQAGVYERVPRNSPSLFNLGAREFTVMFHDGRVEVDEEGSYASGFISPARWKLPEGLDSALAAQAMFPVTSPAEMAGQQGENDVADARARGQVAGPGGVWELVAARLRSIPEYVDDFREAYPERVRTPADVDMVLAANAIAAFEAVSFRADRSPFDEYLRGDRTALSAQEARGMRLFYDKGRCSGCHAGSFQSDQGFHAIAMPQIGPGKSDGWDPGYWQETGIQAFPEDHGRGRVTGRTEDRYRFRTPSLRNVELTAPYGHSGAYASLEEVVRHHLDPVGALESYALAPAALPPLERVLEHSARGASLRSDWLSDSRLSRFLRRDGWVQSHSPLRRAIAAANQLEPLSLTGSEVDDLVAFLHALTDPASRDLSGLVPERVPSGLPIDR